MPNSSKTGPLSVKYHDGMDPECIALCDALNSLPGIRTYESCCGHGRREFMVFLWAKEVENLGPILRAMSDSLLWRIVPYWSNGGEFVGFRLDGPKDPSAGAELTQWILAELASADADDAADEGAPARSQ